jgi:hypothetical protein
MVVAAVLLLILILLHIILFMQHQRSEVHTKEGKEMGMQPGTMKTDMLS